MEENFEEGAPLDCLGLDMFDVVHKSRYRALETRGDVILHLLGGKTVIGPGHANDWNVDVRKDIGRRAFQYKRRQQYDDQCSDDKGVGPSQCESYNPHKLG